MDRRNACPPPHAPRHTAVAAIPPTRKAPCGSGYHDGPVALKPKVRLPPSADCNCGPGGRIITGEIDQAPRMSNPFQVHFLLKLRHRPGAVTALLACLFFPWVGYFASLHFDTTVRKIDDGAQYL